MDLSAKPQASFIGLSPLLIFLGIYLCSSILLEDFYAMPISVAFIITAVYAFAITRGTMEERIELFSRGASDTSILMMIWIFVLAGAFAEGARAIGAVEATVQLILYLLPPSLLLPGLFLSACLISLSIGTSVGTIVALTPIALGFSDSLQLEPAYLAAVVAGGAFFGDNLSFISDTTIAATRTQGVRMRDKFDVNIRIALPAALIVLGLYIFAGQSLQVATSETSRSSILLILPYLVVLGATMWGMNVLGVLVLGILSCGIIGITTGEAELWTWIGELGKGVSSMGELIVVTLLAGGVLALIRYNGGIAFLIEKLSQYIKERRGGEAIISILVLITNACTANNTIAILTAGGIAREISERYGIDRRKSASLLDAYSCVAQGLLPYGAQLLLSAQLSTSSPLDIIPYMYYPLCLGVIASLSILFAYPRLQTKPVD